MPVGGSRHYDGGGLGQEGTWRCPRCGAENLGAIALGCADCGAGRPGRHIGTEPPAPPAPPEPPAPPATPLAADGPDGFPGSAFDPDEQLGPFDRWALAHPQATLEDAFTAGYIEGMRDTRRQLRTPARPAARSTAPGDELPLDPQSKIARTIVAALSYFADQILRGAPPEVTSGEWCSVDEVRALIQQLTTTGEVVHG